MPATLVLDPLAIEDPCLAIHPRCERILCSREDGHTGCHWARASNDSELFFIWHPKLWVARPVLHYLQLAHIAGENDAE